MKDTDVTELTRVLRHCRFTRPEGIRGMRSWGEEERVIVGQREEQPRKPEKGTMRSRTTDRQRTRRPFVLFDMVCDGIPLCPLGLIPGRILKESAQNFTSSLYPCQIRGQQSDNQINAGGKKRWRREKRNEPVTTDDRRQLSKTSPNPPFELQWPHPRNDSWRLCQGGEGCWRV